uniref:Peptidase C1A papain C-terminal domain-containing protein n=1 Tax=Alexandrium catenella TaxID=2925 RepID=A0A7S1SDI8_ALECA
MNARASASWKASLNHFADRTDAELRALLGYKRTGAGGHRHGPRPATSFLSLATERRQEAGNRFPEAVDWRKGLESAEYVRAQGDCGSCWAMASAGALEMHAELRNASAARISSDHLLNCVPNPERCGGAGGCDGATAELAFEFAKQQGVLVKRGNAEPMPPSGRCGPPGGLRAFVGGFVRLPPNRGEPLLEALATRGPVVVSVDASDWFPYESGIFDGCSPDAVVNHAVLAVGYEKRAYIIRNSWGAQWGEQGHIRLLRLGGSGDGHCGVDSSPREGVGCAGGPEEVPVCGMCGVLQDTSYPVDVHFVDSEGASSSSA